jgi:hypothetical protein
MKSEQEVKRFKNAMDKFLQHPCKHDNIIEQLQCLENRQMLSGITGFCTWLLEEKPGEADAVIEDFYKIVKEHIGEEV